MYTSRHGVNVDVSLKVFREGMATVVRHIGGRWVSTDQNTHIHGTSYEMALAMSRIGSRKIYSGTVVAFENGVAVFGPVRGVDSKRREFNKLITYKQLPYSLV